MLLACKCRFGKTVTALAVAKSLEYKKILILTYKPVAQSAWSDDDLSSVINFIYN